MTTLTRPAHRQTAAYQSLLGTLQRIDREFDVDNAVVMRRGADGHYTYIAIGHDGFDIGERVHIHALFPATYRATDDTWQRGETMHSRLFGGRAEGVEYNQFLQINTPLKLGHEVVAIVMLNKFANPVAAAVRTRTVRVAGLSIGIIAVGLTLFAVISARMLRPLKDLTAAAGYAKLLAPGTPVAPGGILRVMFTSMTHAARRVLAEYRGLTAQAESRT